LSRLSLGPSVTAVVLSGHTLRLLKHNNSLTHSEELSEETIGRRVTPNGVVTRGCQSPTSWANQHISVDHEQPWNSLTPGSPATRRLVKVTRGARSSADSHSNDVMVFAITCLVSVSLDEPNRPP
jgi:hypothetical protein